MVGVEPHVALGIERLSGRVLRPYRRGTDTPVVTVKARCGSAQFRKVNYCQASNIPLCCTATSFVMDGPDAQPRVCL